MMKLRADVPGPSVLGSLGILSAIVAGLVGVACSTTTTTGAAPTIKESVGGTIDRAARWLAAFPVERLRFDAAVGLAAIRRRTEGVALRLAFERAKSVAYQDADNPMRRAFDETFRASAERTSRWGIPGPGQPRVNVNCVVVEAMFCAENGLRSETLAYMTGPMRDGGGYHTTHAVWALVLARERGCMPKADFERLARPLLDDLRATQPAEPGAGALDVDLFAERLLMLVLAAGRDARVEAWMPPLIRAQGADGGFGTLAADEDPYHRYHATMVATWALAEWEATTGS
jgi:hypothetical protein